MELATVEQLNLALSDHLKIYNIPRFKSIYFPANSLYDFRAVEYFAVGYEAFPEIPNAIKNAFSDRRRISLLRDKLERMTSPVFGMEYLIRGIVSGEDIKRISARPAFLKQGLLFPLYGPNRCVGVIGVAADPNDLTDFQIRDIQVFCMSIFQRYCEIKLSEDTVSIDLTKREMETLGCLVSGKSNSEIALILGISQSTVNGYVRRLYLKLNVHDRVSAAVKTRELGLHVSKKGMSNMRRVG